MSISLFSGVVIDQNLLYSNVGPITSQPSYTETTNPNVPVPDTSGNTYQFVLGNFSNTPTNDVYPGNAFIGGSVVINPETNRDSSGNRVTSDVSIVSGNINLTGYTPVGISDNKTGNLSLAKSTAKLAVGGSTLTTADSILLDANNSVLSLNDISGTGVSLNGSTKSIRLGPSSTQIIADGNGGNVTLANYSAVSGAAGALNTFLPTTDTSGNAFTFYSNNFITQGLTATSAAPRNYVDTAVDDLYRNLVGTAPSTLDTLQELATLLITDTSGIAAINTALGNYYLNTGGLISGSAQIQNNLDVSGTTSLQALTGTTAVFTSLDVGSAIFGNANQTSIDISGNLTAPTITTTTLNISNLTVGPVDINMDGSGTVSAYQMDTNTFTAGNANQLSIDISGNLRTSESIYAEGIYVVDSSGFAIVDITADTGIGEHIAFHRPIAAYDGVNIQDGLNVQTGNLIVSSSGGNTVTLNPATTINNSLAVTNSLNLSGLGTLNSGVVVNGGNVSLLGNTNTTTNKVYVGLTDSMSIPAGLQLTTTDKSSEIVANGVRYIPDSSGNANIIFGTSWRFSLNSNYDSSGNPINATLKVQFSKNNNSVWDTVAQFMHS